MHMGAESWAPTPQHRRKPRALPEDCIKPVADGTQSRPVWWDCDPSSSTKPLPEWPPERWKCPYHGGCRHRTPRASSPVMDCPVPCPWARREVVEWCDKVNRRLRDSTGRTEHAMEQSSRATEVLWAPLRQWMGQVHMGLRDLRMWERTWDGVCSTRSTNSTWSHAVTLQLGGGAPQVLNHHDRFRVHAVGACQWVERVNRPTLHLRLPLLY
jgi:hypothetical protein